MTEPEMLLKDYVEGRFNRLTCDIDEKLKRQQGEFLAIVSGNDLRYQQRFEAQGRELEKAFSAAKEAVNAALAGADKAAVKTEQTADKRFADLGDLIREQFKGLVEKIDSAVRRIEAIESRINLTSGETAGGQKTKEDQRGLWAVLIAVGAVLLTLWKIFKG